MNDAFERGREERRRADRKEAMTFYLWFVPTAILLGVPIVLHALRDLGVLR